LVVVYLLEHGVLVYLTQQEVVLVKFKSVGCVRHFLLLIVVNWLFSRRSLHHSNLAVTVSGQTLNLASLPSLFERFDCFEGEALLVI